MDDLTSVINYAIKVMKHQTENIALDVRSRLAVALQMRSLLDCQVEQLHASMKRTDRQYQSVPPHSTYLTDQEAQHDRRCSCDTDMRFHKMLHTGLKYFPASSQGHI